MRQSGTAEEQRGARGEHRVWLRERKKDLALWQHRKKRSARRSEERMLACWPGVLFQGERVCDVPRTTCWLPLDDDAHWPWRRRSLGKTL